MTTAHVNRARILVVDDDPVACRALGRLLGDEQFDVLTAERGCAALEVASREPPDIVMTDLKMPDMTGTELCSRLHAVHPDVPVIVVTGFADVSSAVDAIRAGADDYLTKPLDFEAVLLSVQRAIDRRAVQVEKDQLKHQLQDLYRDALATTEAYQDALSIASHDLRNPLTVMDHWVTELSQMSLPAEAQKEILRIAASLGRLTSQMRSLVDDLFDTAAVTMGAVRLSCADYDARELLIQASELRPLALQKHVVLCVRAPADVCIVRGDRQRLGQAINNVLANAIKFTRPGTEIDLSLERVQGGVQFAVRDEGPGIEDDEVGHIFDRFWQGKERRSGLGLGLFIAKRVVDAHRGTIGVERRAGGGCTFHVFVPREPLCEGPGSARS